MVPLPCFFLNCWLLSSRRWSLGLRGDLDSVNHITWLDINKLCNMNYPLLLGIRWRSSGFTSDDNRAALVAGGF